MNAANPYGTIAHTPNAAIWGIDWAARGWRREWLTVSTDAQHKQATLSHAAQVKRAAAATASAATAANGSPYAASLEARHTSAPFGVASFRTLLPAVVGKPIKHAHHHALMAPVHHTGTDTGTPSNNNGSSDSKGDSKTTAVHETNVYDEGSKQRVASASASEALEDKHAADREYALKHPPDLFWMMQTIEVDAPLTYVYSYRPCMHAFIHKMDTIL